MKPICSSQPALYEAFSSRSTASGAFPQLEWRVRSFTDMVVGKPRASNNVWTSRTISTDVFFRVGYPALVSPSASKRPRTKAA